MLSQRNGTKFYIYTCITSTVHSGNVINLAYKSFVCLAPYIITILLYLEHNFLIAEITKSFLYIEVFFRNQRKNNPVGAMLNIKKPNTEKLIKV